MTFTRLICAFVVTGLVVHSASGTALLAADGQQQTVVYETDF